MEQAALNPMRMIRLAKVTLNMGAGEAGPKLDKAKKIMAAIAQRKIVVTTTHKRNTFGGAKNKPIGAMVTLRGKDAHEMLTRMLKAAENRLRPSQFDKSGNFSFGVAEYIDIPGVRYDPDVGIMGLDIAVTLERPGFRVRKRMIRPKPIGARQRITKEEAIEWVRETCGVTVSDEE
ncbi:MAG: 50S ribosomal protein L5 [Candidatus Aenigmarchaeota archaeon]|nr:50S ribosomal protein L5 [Candidatus Aenigmarchaeota archaeon]